MWERYKRFADPQFLSEIPRAGKFESRAWEMRLAVALMDMGFQLSAHQPHGPDISLATNPVVHLEAVAPWGQGNLTYAAPRARVGMVPENSIIMMISSVFDSKREQLRTFREKGVIQQGAPCVIAISTGNIPLARVAEAGDLPLVLKLLYGYGRYQITLNVASGRVLHAGHEALRNRTKPGPKEGSVPADCFCRQEYAAISAVLYTSQDFLNRPETRSRLAGSDFVLGHNPLALHPLPHGWLTRGQEWTLGDGELIRVR
jgi:hypothetical protein